MLKEKKLREISQEELENSTRIQKSATPKYTVDWYVKWVASLLILSAMSMRGVVGFELIDLVLSVCGVALWLWVSIIWKDRALVMLNTAAVAILGIGIVRVLAGV